MDRPRAIRQAGAFRPMMGVFALLLLGGVVAFGQTGSSDGRVIGRAIGRGLANLVMDHPVPVLGALVAWVIVPRVTTDPARSRR